MRRLVTLVPDVSCLDVHCENIFLWRLFFHMFILLLASSWWHMLLPWVCNKKMAKFIYVHTEKQHHEICFVTLFWCDNNLFLTLSFTLFEASRFTWNIHLILSWLSFALLSTRLSVRKRYKRVTESTERKLPMNENQVNPESLWSLLLLYPHSELLIYKSIRGSCCDLLLHLWQIITVIKMY